jgi:hypothetical protein
MASYRHICSCGKVYIGHTCRNIPTTISQHIRHSRGEREVYKVLLGKLEGKRPLGRQRRRWEDGIRMDLRAIGWGSVEWIQLDHDRDRWRAVVNKVMNFRVLVPQSELVTRQSRLENHLSSVSEPLHEGVHSIDFDRTSRLAVTASSGKPSIYALCNRQCSHSCFVFGRSRVQISARRPAILIEIFRAFPQYLQANSGIVH